MLTDRAGVAAPARPDGRPARLAAHPGHGWEPVAVHMVPGRRLAATVGRQTRPGPPSPTSAAWAPPASEASAGHSSGAGAAGAGYGPPAGKPGAAWGAGDARTVAGTRRDATGVAAGFGAPGVADGLGWARGPQARATARPLGRPASLEALVAPGRPLGPVATQQTPSTAPLASPPASAPPAWPVDRPPLDLQRLNGSKVICCSNNRQCTVWRE